MDLVDYLLVILVFVGHKSYCVSASTFVRNMHLLDDQWSRVMWLKPMKRGPKSSLLELNSFYLCFGSLLQICSRGLRDSMAPCPDNL